MEKADWLDDVSADSTAMEEVKQAVEQWRRLRFRRDELENLLSVAEKKYNDFCSDVISKVFRRNGLESLRLEDGSTVEVVEQVRCSIQKDQKTEVAKWLREHGAEQLVKAQLIVMPSAKAQLDSLNIAYDETVDMNTNSVKAWVKGEMNVQNVRVEDLPKGLSWYQFDEIKVKE